MRLTDYLRRIGLASDRDVTTPTLDALRRLHTAHRETFRFDNLAIQCGGSVSVAIEDIERKFLDEGGGGYCFEHNSLFAAALRDIGFAPAVLLGRVRRGPPELWARTHMVLRIDIEERGRRVPWLADVGFGATGLVEPILLADGATSRQRGLEFMLRREDPVWILAMTDGESRSMDLYEFAGDPQTAGDVIVANHYTSTHPDSIFRRALTIQSLNGDDRIMLRTEVLARYRNGVLIEERIARGDLPRVARELFGVELSSRPLVCDSYAAMAIESA